MVFNLFKKKDGASSNQKKDHYFTLKVKEIIHETADAYTIVFQQPEKPLKYEPGQFLTLIQEIEGKKIRRSYSLSSSPYLNEDPAVTIKCVENGLMSNYLHKNLKVGDEMEIMEPMGSFTTVFKPENERHLIMFGGGSGITPMMSIIKSAMQEEPQSIVSLIYANRNVDSIIFKAQLEALEKQFSSRLNVVHVLDNAPINWQGPSGLLNPAMLSDIFKEIPDWGIEKSQYLMCGPEGMMNNVQSLLESMGGSKDRIYKESFVNTTIKKPDAATTLVEAKNDTEVDREVTIIYEGEEFKFTVKPDKTILETALDMDIDLPYSCQSGLCTACRGKCLSGKVKLDEEEGLSEAELEEGYVLTCVGHPVTDDVVIEIG